MKGERTPNAELTHYYVTVVAFLVSLGILLLVVVDIRRGFLFSDYFKVGAPSVLLNLNLGHLPLLLIGGLGMWLAYRYLIRFEKALRARSINLNTLVKVMAIVIVVLLVIDLFTYRGVPASRTLATGKMSIGPGPMGLGRAIPIASLPEWLQPLGEGINYLLIVWHATTLGILLGGLFLTVGAGMAARLKSRSFATHLAASATALAQPFCSCCAAPIGATLYRRGASLGPMLAFTVSAPMLNVTSLILAAALLPTEFALLRIAGGIIIGVLIPYIISLIAFRWVTEEETKIKHGWLLAWPSKLVTTYSRLFHFERFLLEKNIDSPAALISNWLVMAGRLAKVIIPLFIVFSVLAAYIVRAMPDSGNNLLGVSATSFFATLLMVPTWTEIPFAAALINNGLTGIAATVLITLPAVSLPCLAVIAGTVRSLKVAVILGLSVFVTGILAGMVFL